PDRPRPSLGSRNRPSPGTGRPGDSLFDGFYAGCDVFVPGSARYRVAVLAGRELVGRDAGAADAAGFVGVGAAQAVWKGDVAGLHHFGDLDRGFDAAAL